MTSMPASRRARAMILAPRSCPSRPGLAMTTRIGRCMRASLRTPHARGRGWPTTGDRRVLHYALNGGRRPTMPDPYEIIGVRRDASLDEIRIAYRRSAQVLHPDRFATASDGVRAEAAQRMLQLNSAMEEIEDERADEASGTGTLGHVTFDERPPAPLPTETPLGDRVAAHRAGRCRPRRPPRARPGSRRPGSSPSGASAPRRGSCADVRRAVAAPADAGARRASPAAPRPSRSGRRALPAPPRAPEPAPSLYGARRRGTFGYDRRRR